MTERSRLAESMALIRDNDLVLVVHREPARLAEAAEELLAAFGWPSLPVGHELSAHLRQQPPDRRAYAARTCLATRLGALAPGPVLCTDVDLLFEPSLGLDPLALFRQLGRSTRLVVAWPGTYAADLLSYAVPEHRHYRTWSRPAVGIVRLD